MFLDSGYFVFVLPALAFAMYAQNKVAAAFAKYSRQASQGGLTGSQVARFLLDAAGLSAVTIKRATGRLGDHYDPRDKTLALSGEVHSSSSIAALGIAAHEVGHAIQDSVGYAPLRLRNGLVPLAQFGSNLAFPLFFAGLILSIPLLSDAGILLFLGAVLFSIVTLPVEYDASGRAIGLLEAGGYVRGAEIGGVKKVLDAAAMTYLAATAMALAQFLRLVSLRGRRNR